MVDADDVRRVALGLPEVVEVEPDIFFSVPEWDRHPVVLARLDRLDETRLHELVTDAWRMRGGDQLLPGPSSRD